MSMSHPTPGPKDGDLRIWHIAQIPGEPFFVPVNSQKEGALVEATLIRYDSFLYRQNIRGDYCNAGGIQVYREDPNGELDGAGWIDADEEED